MIHLTLKKGDTARLVFTATRQIPAASPLDPPTVTPVDLSGSVKVWFTVKDRAADPDAAALIRKGTANTGFTGVVVSEPTEGKYEVTLDPEDSDGFASGTQIFEWDSQIRELDGTVTTVAAGRVAFTDQITVTSA